MLRLAATPVTKSMATNTKAQMIIGRTGAKSAAIPIAIALMYLNKASINLTFLLCIRLGVILRILLRLLGQVVGEAL